MEYSLISPFFEAWDAGWQIPWQGLATWSSGFENDFDTAVMLVAEGLVYLRSLFKADGVGDDEAGVDLAFLNALEQIVRSVVDVGLGGERLVHRRTEGNLVDQTAVHARSRDNAAWSADINHLAQPVRTIGFHHQCLLGAVIHGVDRACRMRLHAHRVDALVRPFAACLKSLYGFSQSRYLNIFK